MVRSCLPESNVNDDIMEAGITSSTEHSAAASSTCGLAKGKDIQEQRLEDQLTGDRGDRRGAGNETKKKMEKIQKSHQTKGMTSIIRMTDTGTVTGFEQRP